MQHAAPLNETHRGTPDGLRFAAARSSQISDDDHLMEEELGGGSG